MPLQTYYFIFFRGTYKVLCKYNRYTGTLMPSLEKNDPKGLTETQKKIVCTPANTGMLVLAGPGTGKTHTLVHRVLHLVQQQGLVPYSDLLVLSFSRTAIAEIRQRISVMVSSVPTMIYAF